MFPLVPSPAPDIPQLQPCRLMSHFSYSLKSSEVTSRPCLFTPHLPGTLSCALRLPRAGGLQEEGQQEPLPGSPAPLLPQELPVEEALRHSLRHSPRYSLTHSPDSPCLLPFGVCPQLPLSLPLTNSPGAGAGPAPRSGNSSPRCLPGDSARGTCGASRKLPVPLRELPGPSGHRLWDTPGC